MKKFFFLLPIVLLSFLIVGCEKNHQQNLQELDQSNALSGGRLISNSELEDFGLLHNYALEIAPGLLSYSTVSTENQKIAEIVAAFDSVKVNSPYNSLYNSALYQPIYNSVSQDIYSHSFNSFVDTSFWNTQISYLDTDVSEIEKKYIKRIIRSCIQANEIFIANDQINTTSFSQLSASLSNIQTAWENEEFGEDEGYFSGLILQIAISSNDYWALNTDKIYFEEDSTGIMYIPNPGLIDAGGAVLGVITGVVATNVNTDPDWRDYVWNGVIGGILGGFSTSFVAVSNVGRWFGGIF